MSDIEATFRATIGYRNPFVSDKWILLAEETFATQAIAEQTVKAAVQHVLDEYKKNIPCQVEYHGGLAGFCFGENDGRILFEVEGGVTPQRIHNKALDPADFLLYR